MGRLAEQAFKPESLHRAWLEVEAKDSADGVTAPSIAAFRDDLADNLHELRDELLSGGFTGRPLTEVLIDQGDKIRCLHIPAARDRVVARAILPVITPLIDPVLGPDSFAYRPGYGVADAVQAVVRLREQGRSWVLRTDVHDCFPNIPVPHVRAKLADLLPDDHLLAVIDGLLTRPYRDQAGRQHPMRGLPQGCSLSPVLANLTLVDLDDGLACAGFAPVRYADDIVVVVQNEQEARDALDLCQVILGRLGMTTGADKTEIMSFSRGFCFLGEDFGPRYPPLLPDQHIREPDHKVVYIGLQGCRVHIARGRFLVHGRDDAKALDVPTGQVDSVVCFGAVGVSAGARSWALERGVAMVFCTRNGSYLGTLSASKVRPSRIRAQLRAHESGLALNLARQVIDSKISKQAIVLRHFSSTSHAEAVADATAQIARLRTMLPDCHTPEEVMGIEGAAARAYFPTFGALFPDPLGFTLRSRQPPLDLANSALSYLYAVLLGECTSAVCAAGLDPSLGVLHADNDRRPSLALDLMEEFRPLIVDRTVLEAARHSRLRPEHAQPHQPGQAGVLLTKVGRESLLNEYERRMLTRIGGAVDGFKGSFRRHLFRQAQRLAASLVDPDRPWTGLSWR